MSDELVWIDLETTGLDEHRGRILEVGAVVTDAKLNVKAGYHALIGPPLTMQERRELHPAVSSMHNASGLIRDLDERKVQTIATVDDELKWWLFSQLPGGNLMLAGSSVHFDRAWMRIHMPESFAQFGYRNADVSGLREFIRRWYPDHDEEVQAVKQNKAHRSMLDIEDTLCLANFYRGLILRATCP